MNLNKIQLSPFQKISGIALIILAAVILTLTWVRLNATASELPTLDDATLQAKALVLAQNYGLQGEPDTIKIQRMSFADSMQLVNSELGKDAGQFGLTPDMPVFILALRGKVEPTGPRQIDPENPNPKYDRMLIILNAHNGDLLLEGDYYVGAPIPIEPG